MVLTRIVKEKLGQIRNRRDVSTEGWVTQTTFFALANQLRVQAWESDTHLEKKKSCLLLLNTCTPPMTLFSYPASLSHSFLFCYES